MIAFHTVSVSASSICSLTDGALQAAEKWSTSAGSGLWGLGLWANAESRRHASQHEHRLNSRVQRGVYRRETMADSNKDDERAIRTGDDGSTSVSDSSLLPMLVTSLVLIVVGMIAVIIFV